MFGLCVSFSGTKLSYFSCVLYELNFHSVFDVATSCLRAERIRDSLWCLSKLNEGLPPSCNILSCGVCTSSWVAFGVSLAKTLLYMANTFIWQAGKVLERFSFWHNYCPNTGTGAKLLHLPQILQGCALLCVCVCGYEASLGQTLPSCVI